MAISKTSISLEISAKIGNLKCIFSLHKKPCLSGKECQSFPHEHGNLYELRYVAAGNGVQTVQETPYPITKGDLLLIHPREYHYQKSVESSPDLVQYSIRFFFPPPPEGAPQPQQSAYVELMSILQSTRLLRDEKLKLLPFWEKLMVEFLDQKYGYANCLQAQCVLILTEFLRLSPQKSKHLFRVSNNEHLLYWRDQLDLLLSERYMEDLKLEDVANEIGLSPRQVSRVFLREYGTTYSAKLANTRLQQAKFQLRHTDKDIHRICLDCGFRSYGYFTTCFRKSLGMTPSEYRSATIDDDSDVK